MFCSTELLKVNREICIKLSQKKTFSFTSYVPNLNAMNV